MLVLSLLFGVMFAPLVLALRAAGQAFDRGRAAPARSAGVAEELWPVRRGQIVPALPLGCWGRVELAAPGPDGWVIGVQLQDGRPAALRLHEIVR